MVWTLQVIQKSSTINQRSIKSCKEVEIHKFSSGKRCLVRGSEHSNTTPRSKKERKIKLK